ncbi:Uncharacterized protein BM_BM538 [Brugia malayi]|uniref:Bm538 n=1 Tax=Brugia malayi TaxID=6279 RepID=A0A4E9EZZ6_BRUMA|nr:Uncharacterized protein BM_BM538 [Brugia malayi]
MFPYVHLMHSLYDREGFIAVKFACY